MSWSLILLLGAGSYACKAIGVVVLGGRTLPAALSRCLALIPAALIAALIMTNTFADGQSLVLDARSVGVGAAVIAAWRKAPLILVIVIGATVTAVVRAL